MSVSLLGEDELFFPSFSRLKRTSAGFCPHLAKRSAGTTTAAAEGEREKRQGDQRERGGENRKKEIEVVEKKMFDAGSSTARHSYATRGSVTRAFALTIPVSIPGSGATSLVTVVPLLPALFAIATPAAGSAVRRGRLLSAVQLTTKFT